MSWFRRRAATMPFAQSGLCWGPPVRYENHYWLVRSFPLRFRTTRLGVKGEAIIYCWGNPKSQWQVEMDVWPSGERSHFSSPDARIVYSAYLTPLSERPEHYLLQSRAQSDGGSKKRSSRIKTNPYTGALLYGSLQRAQQQAEAPVEACVYVHEPINDELYAADSFFSLNPRSVELDEDGNPFRLHAPGDGMWVDRAGGVCPTYYTAQRAIDGDLGLMTAWAVPDEENIWIGETLDFHDNRISVVLTTFADRALLSGAWSDLEVLCPRSASYHVHTQLRSHVVEVPAKSTHPVS